MNWQQALILGVIQGLTEFLPVSSSGHLVIFQNLFRITESSIIFDVFVHLWTVIAVLVFFRRKILNLNKKQVFLLSVASLPVFVIGFLLSETISHLFMFSLAAGIGLLVSAILNFSTHHLLNQANLDRSLDWIDSIKIGLAQSIAIIPGISRSGATIFGSVTSGLDEKQAFEFSFLLSIPVILGANFYQFQKLLNSGSIQIQFENLLIGGAAAFLSSLVGIRLVKKFLLAKKFYVFGWYCLLVGITVIILNVT